MDKILVVGGAGYIGSVLVRQLLDDGCEVRVLDQLLFGAQSIRDLFGNRRFQFIEGDFRDSRLVAEAARGADALIHLGAIVGDPACQIDESQPGKPTLSPPSSLPRHAWNAQSRG